MTPLPTESSIRRTIHALHFLYQGDKEWARYNIRYLTGQFREYE